MPNHALELTQVGYFEVEWKNAIHFVFISYLATTCTNILRSINFDGKVQDFRVLLSTITM